MHATLLLPEYNFLGPRSVIDVENHFQRYDLWTGERKPKLKPPQRCRYEADYVNLIWHMDLYPFHRGDWIIGWMHDRSRMCPGFGFLPKKGSAETAKALAELLQ
jgi:hypothetical protein